MIFDTAFSVLQPKPPMRTIDWAREYGFTETGQPYSDYTYPHLSAPGGPLDAADCDYIFDIWLQWGSRLGKTFGGQIAMLKKADMDPCPMMFASSNEKVATEVVERTYSMIEQCQPLKGRLPPPNRRRQSRINLKVCRVYVAWALSVSTLADKSVRFGHAAEIDKWEHQLTSKEADPLKLFDDRCKEFPTFKRWKESTPALKQGSRVERGRLASSNASFWVPCPACGRYQVLRMGDGKSPGGIVWEHKDGKSDRDLANNTGRYVCKHCEAELYDDSRGTMMRAGVWIPEGCGCDDEQARETVEAWREPGRQPWGGWKESPWITGEPVRDGRDWGSQLSSLYALSLTWGSVAAEFVGCKKNPQNLRNFVNQWLAETWEITRHKATWEQLGQKLMGVTSQAVCPPWASFLTLGVDRQAEGGDRFPWLVSAWGPGRQCAVIACGEADSLLEVENEVIGKVFKHADSGASLPVVFGLIDSGFRPDGIYEFCREQARKKRDIWPSKGSNIALESDYKKAELGKNTSMPGMILFHIDTIRSQLWMEGVLHVLKRDDPGGASIYAESLGHHQDLLEQLLNDSAVTELDSHNNARESWDRINTNIPNDYRDCWRNAYVAMLIYTRGKPIPARKVVPMPAKSEEKGKPNVNNIIERPGGWIQQRRN